MNKLRDVQTEVTLIVQVCWSTVNVFVQPMFTNVVIIIKKDDLFYLSVSHEELFKRGESVRLSKT